MRLIGYRAGGRPGPNYPEVSDTFALPQAAVECARRLQDTGWLEVACDRVLADRDGTEVLEALEWRVGASV